MADGYSVLAPVYDRLNDTVDYAAWADFLEACIERFGSGTSGTPKDGASILDLGCGTGSMTIELAKRGYDMTALDLSEDMLAEADVRAREAGLDNILFLCENMCCFDLYGTVDHIVCCLDGINHLTNREDLLECFSNAAMFLNPGGLFMFDLNTPYKFKPTYADRDYILEDDGIMCCWRNRLNKKGDVVTFYLTVYEENEDGTWERTDGEERERAYGLRSIKNALESCGLELVNVSAGYDFAEPDETCGRWYITARKANG